MRQLSGLILVIALVACGGAAGSRPRDAGPAADAGTGCVASPVGSCSPSACSTGNASNIGAYCSQGGGECAGYPNGANLVCAVDLEPTQTNAKFCISIGCPSNAACGSGACCYQGQACIPLECAANDAGICPAYPAADGGSGDAG